MLKSIAELNKELSEYGLRAQSQSPSPSLELENERGGDVDLAHESSANFRNNAHADHPLRSCRETRYRELYISARDEYEKLKEVHFEVKRSHRDIIKRWQAHPCAVGDRVPDNESTDATTEEDTDDSEGLHTSAPHSRRDSPQSPEYRPCSPTLPEMQKEDPARDNGAELQDVATNLIRKSPDTEGFRAPSPYEQVFGEPVKSKRTPPGSAGPRLGIPPWMTGSQTPKPLLKGNTQNAPGIETVQIPLPADEDSDEPVVISERSLKRKRANPKQRAVADVPQDAYHPNGNVPKTIYIKSDPAASSPLATVTPNCHANLYDGVDLDDVGHRTITPRKRRRMGEEMRPTSGLLLASEFHPASDGNSHNFDEPRHQGVQNGPTKEVNNDISRVRSEIYRLPSPALPIERPSAPGNPPQQSSGMSHSLHQRWLSEHARSSPHNRGTREGNGARRGSDENSETSNQTCASRATLDPTVRNILAPINPNRKMLPRIIDLFSEPPPARQDQYNFRGETYDSSSGLPSRDGSCDVLAVKYLGSSLGRDVLQPNDVENAELRPWDSDIYGDMNHEQMASANPARICLRRQPPSHLRPEDFKINPRHNQGVDYPYSHVIRNRDERKCMNGCTRPDCCGLVLQKAIEIGGPTVLRGCRLQSIEDEEREDQRVLEEYLGDNKHKLAGMPEDERNRLLAKARTELFAKKFGKHRHTYERAPTPPGYWNPDMPTTQEEMANRMAANAMERERVDQMYTEAMRHNGKYMFQDE